MAKLKDTNKINIVSKYINNQFLLDHVFLFFHSALFPKLLKVDHIPKDLLHLLC